MTAPPIPAMWTGDGWEVAPNFRRVADKHFTIGETYTMAVHEERSQASHNHFFAAVHEGWTNLPEAMAERFSTSEKLRKFALIRTGYCDERSIVCKSKAEAERLAAFVQPMDDFALVVTSNATLTVYTAKSQSMKAMGRETFNASKEAVLDYIADLIGVSPADLAKARAA